MKSSPEYIIIGQILSSWGTSGQVKVAVMTDYPDRFSPSSEVWLDSRPVLIESTEWRKGQAIIKFDTINTIEAADELRGSLHRDTGQPAQAASGG
jgi:16S rRNA processing protein RimM